jgi:hypothetical protein
LGLPTGLLAAGLERSFSSVKLLGATLHKLAPKSQTTVVEIKGGLVTQPMDFCFHKGKV